MTGARTLSGCAIVAIAGAVLGDLSGAGSARADFIAVSWSQAELVRIDSDTGQVTTGFGLGAGTANAMTKMPDGRLIVAVKVNGQTDRLWTVRDDGVLGFRPGFVQTTLTDIRSMATDRRGNVYAMVNASLGSPFEFYRLNPDTGAGTLVGTVNGDSFQAMTFGADGVLYAWRNNLGLHAIDPATGQATRITPPGTPDGFHQSLALTPAGDLITAGGLGTTEFTTLYRVDTTTGLRTPYLGLNYGSADPRFRDLRGMEWIPAPATTGLLLAGGLWAARRRRG